MPVRHADGNVQWEIYGLEVTQEALGQDISLCIKNIITMENVRVYTEIIGMSNSINKKEFTAKNNSQIKKKKIDEDKIPKTF